MKLQDEARFGLTMKQWFRIYYAWLEARWALLSMVVFATGVIAKPHWATVGVLGVGLLIATWAMHWEYRSGRYTFDVLGMEVEVRSRGFDLEPDDIEELIKEQVRKWARIGRLEQALDAVDGISYVLEPEVLTVPKINDEGKMVWVGAWGATYPGYATYVYAPLALDDGVGGHELRLQMAHRIYGAQSEEDDLEQMKEDGIT